MLTTNQQITILTFYNFHIFFQTKSITKTVFPVKPTPTLMNEMILELGHTPLLRKIEDETLIDTNPVKME